MDKFICGTTITGDMLEKVLKTKFGNTSSHVSSLESQPIAAGEGFMSKIIRIKINWTNQILNKGQEKLPSSVILKAPSAEMIESFTVTLLGESETKYDFQDMMREPLRIEILSYKLLEPLGFIPMAKCYASEEPETELGYMVLEDLGASACICQWPKVQLSEKQLYNIVEIVANLHAWSLCTEVQLSDYFHDLQHYRDPFIAIMTAMKNSMISMKKMFPAELGEINESKLDQLLQIDNFIKIADNHVGVMPPVLVHNDFWSNNIMFKLNPVDNKITDEVFAVIDWASTYLGSCMVDFGRLLSFCPKQFREAHIGELLHKYYDIVQMKAGSKFTASFKDIERMFEQQLALNVPLFFTNAHLDIASKSEDNANTKRIVEIAKDSYELMARVFQF